MGRVAACYPALRGLKAVVLDKSRIAGRQSTRAWGFVRQHRLPVTGGPASLRGVSS